NLSLISGIEPTELAVSGNDLFVESKEGGTVGEYTTSGATVNASLITGLDAPQGIAVAAVPEPSTWAALIAGIGILGIGQGIRHHGARSWLRHRSTLKSCPS
ncbi:MAG TPA: PEP-CTERM sorting domain-containing protein, partial [Chthoniobacteraceae bacterium]|nr:PEP-CTERM sorting domain-containing protein [Chthoniobacteraceae bacterium]